jgi:aspartate racemase
MKTIGMLGGMSWESTVLYYREVNRGIKASLGGLHSAKIVMVSVDFDEIEKLQHTGDWDRAGEVLGDAAARIEIAGADFLLICTNTMHKLADRVQSRISIPLLHIADATAKRLIDDDIERVGVLGTAFTMEQDFYRGRLSDRHGLEVVVPGPDDRETVHDIIYRELCLGVVREESRQRYIEVMQRLKRDGAQAVILGCTEITMLVGQGDFDLPQYDTTAIHAHSAVDAALK